MSVSFQGQQLAYVSLLIDLPLSYASVNSLLDWFDKYSFDLLHRPLPKSRPEIGDVVFWRSPQDGAIGLMVTEDSVLMWDNGPTIRTLEFLKHAWPDHVLVGYMNQGELRRTMQ